MRARTISIFTSFVVGSALLGCGDDTESTSKSTTTSACSAAALPLTSTADAPTLSRLVLNCESGGQLVPEVIVTDPQGDPDLQNVTQLLIVHKTKDCTGEVVELQDDVVASGEAEWFGTAVDRTDEPALFDTICASASWPVGVRIRDASGNETRGVIDARVVLE